MQLLATVKFRVLLGVSAASVLGLGLAMRPPVPAPAPIVDEAPAPILQQVVQQREVETIYRRMRQTARRVAHFTVRLSARSVETTSDEWGPPEFPPSLREGFGVHLGGREILAAAADLQTGAVLDVVTAAGRHLNARVTKRFPETGLAILETAESVHPDAPQGIARAVEPGSLLFGAGPWTPGDVVAPIFVAAVDERELLTTSSVERFQGMAVFTVEGELAGVIGRVSGIARVLPLSEAMRAAAPESAGPTSSTASVPGER